jgi:hypothetical protein
MSITAFIAKRHHKQWFIWALLMQLPIALIILLTEILVMTKRSMWLKHVADDKSFISSLNILFNSELFSSFAISRSKHPSQTSQAYSNVVLMQVRYTSMTYVHVLIVLEMGAQTHPHLSNIIVIKHHIN